MSVNASNELWRLASTGVPSLGIPPVKVKLVKRLGGFTRTAAEATEIYIIRAEDLTNFVRIGLPLPISGNYGIPNYPGRAAFYGVPALVVNTMKWKGLNDSKPVDPFDFDGAYTTFNELPGAVDGTYDEFVEVTVTYAPVKKSKNKDDSDDNDPSTFLEVTSTGGGQFLNSPIDGKAEWWNVNYDPVAKKWLAAFIDKVEEKHIPNTILSPTVEWNVHWPQIPYNLFYGRILPLIRARVGTVNEFVSNLIHFSPPHTLLLMNYSAKETYTWDNVEGVGKPPMSVDLKFIEKNFIAPGTVLIADPGGGPFLTSAPGGIQVTHQHYYRPGKGWQALSMGRTDVPAGSALQFTYASTDHNAIWAPTNEIFTATV